VTGLERQDGDARAASDKDPRRNPGGGEDADAPRLGGFLLYLKFRRPSEKRIAVEFLNGTSVGHIARKYGVAEGTCRKYVHNVHREHGTSNQLELLEKGLREFWRRHQETLRPLLDELLRLRESHERHPH